MASSINIELSFKSDIPKNIMFEFRNYLRKEIPGLEFNIKELPPLPGRMGDEINWVNVILYATTVASIELGVHKSLESINEKIIDRIKRVRDSFVKESKFEKLEISGSVRYDNTKSSFKIDENKIHYYNEREYSINPEHTYVLLAGCGEFRYSQIAKIPPVEGNLQDLYQLMIEPQYFGIPADHITLSFNEDSDTIQDHLYEISKTNGIETFIFYYAGHGFCTDKDSYFLAAYNTQKKNDFINGGIDKDFIKNKILVQSPAKQKIAIIDACYSGILTQGGNANTFGNEVKGSYILTSSNADEVSFYDKSESNTYFTGALLKTIKEGLNNSKNTITLDDLYIGTCEKLKEKKLQEPMYKNGLNIDPSKFAISLNPTFSIENEHNKPYELIKQGKFDEASYQFKRLLKKYPEDNVLRSKSLQFENDWMYTRLVNEGDRLFHELKDFSSAAEHYDKALELKEDMVVRDKLQTCINKIEKICEAIAPNTKKEDMKYGVRATAVLSPNRKKLMGKIIISFVAIFLAVGIAKIVFYDKVQGSSEFEKGLNLYKNYKIAEALRLFEESVEKGFPRAYTLLGICNLNGRGTKINYDEAKRNFEIALAKGDKIANEYLGLIYSSGLGVKKDSVKSDKYYRDVIPELQKRVSDADWFAENLLANHLLDGKYIEPDTARAISLYEKSAKEGFFVAQYNLGIKYRDGIGFKKNINLAIDWLRKTSDQGNVTAFAELGLIYQTERKYSEAEKWYRKGSNENGDCQFNLGCLFEEGLGRNINLDSAIMWFERAGENNNSSGSYKMAYYHLTDQKYKNILKGEEWLNKAIEQGNPDGCYLFGYYYDHEEKDYNQAALWFKKAAKTESYLGKYALAQYYEQGKGGIIKDTTEAYNLYQLVIVNSNTDTVTLSWSLYKIGLFYKLGSGIEKNYRVATTYLEKVANLGNFKSGGSNSKACSELANIYKTGGWGIEKNTTLSEKWSYQTQLKTVKIFTVPCLVDGELDKRNFQIYVRKKYELGEIPIQDEYDRLRKDFKATIPNDVMSSFAKLYDIAIKNKVDFLDLCVYALGKK